jgi:transcriptional regulator with XRE-family HTH domain
MRMRKPEEIGRDLQRFMARHALTEREMAERASLRNGVVLSQPWVSRISRGKFKRPTDRLRCLAAFAKIAIFEKGSVSELGEKRIRQALKTSWNGSLAQATVIANLIKATRGLT